MLSVRAEMTRAHYALYMAWTSTATWGERGGEVAPRGSDVFPGGSRSQRVST